MKPYLIDGKTVYIDDIIDIREYVSEGLWEAISDQFMGLENEVNELESNIEELERIIEERDAVVCRSKI